MIQEIENDEEVLASVSWEDKAYDKTTNPWKDFTDKRCCRDDVQEETFGEIAEEKKESDREEENNLPTKKTKFGMREAWPVEKSETILD